MQNIETLALHAGEQPDPTTGALRVPIHMAASFKLPRFGKRLFDALLLEGDEPPHAYSRWSNPTLSALEERLAALERFDPRNGGRN
ncbi:MAG: PLP-dependent transferase, partial [Anaerolineae bacterium]